MGFFASVRRLFGQRTIVPAEGANPGHIQYIHEVHKNQLSRVIALRELQGRISHYHTMLERLQSDPPGVENTVVAFASAMRAFVNGTRTQLAETSTGIRLGIEQFGAWEGLDGDRNYRSDLLSLFESIESRLDLAMRVLGEQETVIRNFEAAYKGRFDLTDARAASVAWIDVLDRQLYTGKLKGATDKAQEAMGILNEWKGRMLNARLTGRELSAYHLRPGAHESLAPLRKEDFQLTHVPESPLLRR